MSLRRCCRCWPVLLMSVSCGNDSPDHDTGSSAEDAAALELPYAPCAPEAGVGEFSIDLGPDYTSAQGKVLDSVMTDQLPVMQAQAGDCRLLTSPKHLCDPACPVATQICGAGNRCVDLPSPRDVGAVTLSGLLVPVRMSPNPVTGNYHPEGGPLPYPAYRAGAGLQLHAQGGEYDAFELGGWGVSALELTTDPVVVESGAATQLAWKVPRQVGPARVQLALHLDNHGSSNAWIECDVADQGSAEIPATLIDGLLTLGRSGFPTVTLTRRTATSTGMDLGCVQLLVTSSVTAGVSLAGLVSCNDSSMCPSGQTCRPLLRYCE
ncbi:MAG TPA: hypothetical protein VFS67_04200 [Polyangiaceae bacterium]|nr:hypothetical protein [Polyangiaceae bacterium]